MEGQIADVLKVQNDQRQKALKRAWWSSSFLREEHGTDWTTVPCGGGMVVLGGGCEAKDERHVFQYNGPNGRSAWTWTCGGHGGTRRVGWFWDRRDEHYGHKRVWAICAPENGPVKVTQKSASAEKPDWTARGTLCLPKQTWLESRYESRGSLQRVT